MKTVVLLLSLLAAASCETPDCKCVVEPVIIQPEPVSPIVEFPEWFHGDYISVYEPHTLLQVNATEVFVDLNHNVITPVNDSYHFEFGFVNTNIQEDLVTIYYGEKTFYFHKGDSLTEDGHEYVNVIVYKAGTSYHFGNFIKQ